MHLLLIDEDVDFGKKLRNIKTNHKITVDCCADVGIAASRLQKKQYDLIVLEIFKNETCHLNDIIQLRNISRIPLVVITKYPSISTAIVAIKSGADDYYAKASDLNVWLGAYLENIQDKKISRDAPKYTPIENLQWDHMNKTLQDTGGNITAAAKLLGINRRTLHRKINQHNVK